MSTTSSSPAAFGAVICLFVSLAFVSPAGAARQPPLERRVRSQLPPVDPTGLRSEWLADLGLRRCA